MVSALSPHVDVREHRPERGEAAPQGRPTLSPDGLVEEATSNTRVTRFPPEMTIRDVRSHIARQRRVRRMRRVVLAHADQVRAVPGFRVEPVMVTATYRPGELWNQRQVSRFVARVRVHLARRGIPLKFQWVIEHTKKGVPHYHLLFWLPHGFQLPKPDEQGWWPHGMTRIERARSAVGYLVKYATKGFDGELPKGARLFGCGGDAAARFQAHRAGLPGWLNAAATPGERLERVTGLGWMEKGTGEVHASPFRMCFRLDPGGGWILEVTR